MKKSKSSQSQKSEAVALAQQGRFAEALPILTQVCNDDPSDADAWFILGVLSGKLNYADASLECFRTSISLSPDNALAQYNLGVALCALERNAEAVEAFREVIRLEPRRPEAYANLGVLFITLGQFDEAEAHFRTLLTINPDESEALAHLGRILYSKGELYEAIQLFQKVLELVPDHAGAYDNLAIAYSDQGQYENAIPLHRRSMQLCANTHPFVHSNLLLTLQYVPDADPREVLEEHKRWAVAHGNNPNAPTPHANNRDTGRRLRVGYVSPDFRAHSVACFFEPLLRGHDRGVVDAYCYSTTLRPDETTARLRKLASNWRDAGNMPDDRLVEQIRVDEIDILVDLSGHSGLNRLKVFSQRPAPVQVTWLGYPDTTGLDSIDYRLTDGNADPDGADEFFTERLVRMPGCFLCYQPLDVAPSVTAPPEAKNGYITFGSFNNLAKINQDVVSVWGRLLQAVPASRLIVKSRPLSDKSTRERYYILFEQTGVERERVELLGHTTTQTEHLALYSRIDIALDSFPYNGTTTTCEALWMGVPVVTLTGKRHSGRVGTSLLTAAGLSDWIARTPEEYIIVAARFATDPQYLVGLRARLRGQISVSPLCDGTAFARDIETAFREMWRQWCAT